MPPTTLTIPWGKEHISMELPENWKIIGRMEPTPQPGASDPFLEVERALAAPFGSPCLRELARTGMKVALVIDDDSRPTPVARILPSVLEELGRGGVGMEDVSFIPALGVHRPMTAAEVEKRTGLDHLMIVNHDPDAPEKLAYLGRTSRGTPVYLNKTAAEADLIVSIGCIEPHIIASFGGGYKNLIPGIAGRNTIAKNHAINCQPGTFNNVGQPMDRNPMRLDLEEGARLLKPPVFVVNAVLNSSLEMVKVVCGNPVEAHRAGAAVSAGIYGARVPAPADIVITSSNPMDQDLRQGVKALANTIRALKPGGVMICLVRAEEGVGVFGLANKKLPLGRAALKFLAPVILPLVPKLKLRGMGEEDRFFLYFALQALRHGDLLMYAPTIPVEIHERLPFVIFKSSVADAIQQAAGRFPQGAEVLVFPNGGSTYPILPEA